MKELPGLLGWAAPKQGNYPLFQNGSFAPHTYNDSLRFLGRRDQFARGDKPFIVGYAPEALGRAYPKIDRLC